MKTLLILFMLLFSALAFAQNEVSCCICAADLSDISTSKECARWLKENRKECSYQKQLPHYMSYAYSLDENVRCESMKVFAAYHGLSRTYYHTFFLIQDLVENYDPKEVSFDGSTCLIFNNVDKVQDSAKRLSKLFPQVYFDLSGNQNLGAVFSIPLIYRPKETMSMSSKMTVKAKNGQVETSFGACSKPNGKCFFADSDVGATNDSNTKFCMEENKLTTQMCCLRKKIVNGVNGLWSNPGEICDAQG